MGIEKHPIKLILDLSGLTQYELSKKTGISRTNLNMFLNGRMTLQDSDFTAILNFFNMTRSEYDDYCKIYNQLFKFVRSRQ